jgi:hypothetical protein
MMCLLLNRLFTSNLPPGLDSRPNRSSRLWRRRPLRAAPHGLLVETLR